MALFELVSGDFERESVRLRYSEAGRAYVRLRSVDGVVEDVFLETDVAGVAEGGEGPLDEAGSAARPALRFLRGRRPEGRCELLFVTRLRDGRKFVGRGSTEAVAEVKAAASPGNRGPGFGRPAEARRSAGPGEAVPSLLPGFIARLLPNR